MGDREKMGDKEKLIKSKQRVKDFAEVFTPKHIVKKMVSLVDENFTDKEYLHKTWFDPAVGTGNFPAEILERKLDWCKKHNYTAKQALEALATIYAVDIQEDNVLETQKRLFMMWRNAYDEELFGSGLTTDKIDDNIRTMGVALGIIRQNIVVGDTITYPEKINLYKTIFDETGEIIDMVEFTLADMLGEEGMKDVEEYRKKQAKKQAKKQVQTS